MMPRIDAQENLDAIRGRGIAFGSYEGRDAQDLLRELRRKAYGDDEVKPRTPTPANLSAMGIGIVSVPSQAGVNDV